jgi:hypothetical protein
MAWVIEFAVQPMAELFGYAAGRKRPWWVELIATLGCLVVLGVPILLLWVSADTTKRMSALGWNQT